MAEKGWTFDTSGRRDKASAPQAKKADDRSWGLGELFSGWGEQADEPDTGPRLGGRGRAPSTDPFDPARYDRRLPSDTGASKIKWPWED